MRKFYAKQTKGRFVEKPNEQKNIPLCFVLDFIVHLNNVKRHYSIKYFEYEKYEEILKLKHEKNKSVI